VLADLEFEADDFIATLARRARSDVVIVSRDKDLQQLLAPGVLLRDPADGSTTDATAFQERFGFEPAAFPDYQALTGDSVDNVPGVRGIGPKTAQRLVAALGPLEAIYAAQSAWPDAGLKPGSRAAERLLEGQEAAFLYRRVLRLDDRVPLPAGVTGARLKPPGRAELDARLGALGLAEGLGSGVARALEAYCG
jgi:DNA polymerase-1